MNAIELSGLAFGYGERLLFDGFNLEVASGEFLGVIGPNGAGKSTLLRLVSGLLRPASGSVRILGQDLGALGRREVARTLGVVLQENPFAFDYSVSDVVMMGRNPYLGRFQSPGRHDREAVNSALEFVDALFLRDKRINSISAGERQRVVLARALAQEPAILMLDEATSHLDIAHQQLIARILLNLNRQGKTVVFLSHDLNLAALYCSRILLLDRGKAVACDVPERVITIELIRSVYGVEPIVTRHPESGRPQIMLPTASGG
ncbi:MAG TPA: ABC transporter ATP-binding protein [bacterium]|nr:ABC transporter ATP-binding protein [bacterium]